MGNTNIRVNTSLFELELKPKFEINPLKVNRKRERESESENETINNSKKFKPLVSEKKNKQTKLQKQDYNFNSSICNASQISEILQLCEFDINTNLDLVYKGSESSFSVDKFHRECDYFKRLFFIIKSDNHIFGAYSGEHDWSGYELKADKTVFIYSYANSDREAIKFTSEDASIYSNPDVFIQFGSDLLIGKEECNSIVGKSNLGHLFDHPKYTYKSNEANSFLGGFEEFKVDEFEVYR